jgi:hypothetical protein
MRLGWLAVCAVACSTPQRPVAHAVTPCPAPAPVAAPPKQPDPDQLARACGISAILLDEAVHAYQLLAHDIAREAELGIKLDDPKRAKDAMEQMLGAIVGVKPSFWAIANGTSAILSSTPLSREQLASEAVKNALREHTFDVWIVNNRPQIVVAIPIVRTHGRAVLVLGREIDARTIEHLGRSTLAQVSIVIDPARAKQLDHCKVEGDAATHAFGSAVVTIKAAASD